ncbi:MAG: gliding motility-associated C-terminal domain-containing protein [Bacteroidales bacterium]|nr:gliding motility-associated C-terminal domain-containing protein [Bacteroidales bacterium]
MKKIYTYLFFLICITASIEVNAALDPPSLRCLEVKQNGDVLISWVAPNDANGEFNSFQIFYSNSVSGTYSQIATISNFAQNNFLHTGANAQSQDAHYYLITVSNGATLQYSIPSDTLSIIKLTASNPLNGTAPLSWNHLSSNALPSAYGYSVFYEYPANNWIFLGKTSSNYFIDTIEVCNDFINFKIEQTDASGCKSVSTIDGDIYKNLIAPQIPILDSVSINHSSQNATIGWQPSVASDTKGYIIYFFDGVWKPIDTVFGINNTFYENILSQASKTPESYCIAAIDSCGNTSPLTPKHTSILLNVNINRCERNASLEWTQYSGFPDGILEYTVSIIENNNVITHKKINSNSYTTDALNDNSTYCFYVTATSKSGSTSSSNTICQTVDFPDMPAWIYIRHASVNADNSVEIKWACDSSVAVSGYAIQRSIDTLNSWTTCHITTFAQKTEYSYNDFSANADAQPVFYRIAAIDECNTKNKYSNTAKTIHLSGQVIDNMQNEISWNSYEGWQNEISEFQLFRGINNVFENVPINIFDKNTNYFVDNVSDLSNSNGAISYKILAIENSAKNLNYKDSAWSNTFSIKQTPIFYMPNAFAPNGKNNTFGPVGMFIDNDGYSLSIYNRFGQEVFRTNDFSNRWDGTVNGSDAPMGTYIYLLEITQPNGKKITQCGCVNLIR